ncbi:MAG TPA: PKD domain-containing protein [Saprospiraceae bacterium]|nr:PKD domain-containing protein [Saprospiraceae bacterium]
MRIFCIRIIASIYILSVFEVNFISGQEAHFTPVISMDEKEFSGCRPLAISFINYGAPNLTYFWNFMDGSPVSNLYSPYHVYSTSGIYKVEMLTYDSLASFSDTTIIKVTVFPIPRSEFVIVDKPYYERADSIQLVNVSTGADLLYWTINGDNFPGPKFQFLPDTSGMYTISLVAENTFGCRDTIVKTVEVLKSPVSLRKP